MSTHSDIYLLKRKHMVLHLYPVLGADGELASYDVKVDSIVPPDAKVSGADKFGTETKLTTVPDGGPAVTAQIMALADSYVTPAVAAQNDYRTS